MPQEVLSVKRDRFDLLDSKIYILQGNFPVEKRPRVFLDHTELDVQMEEWKPSGAMERFESQKMSGGKRVTMKIWLPEKTDGYKRLRVFAEGNGKKRCWYSVSAGELFRKQDRPYYYIEEAVVDHAVRNIKIRGWAVFAEPVVIQLYDAEKRKLNCEIQRVQRNDVCEMFEETAVEKKCGFYLEADVSGTDRIFLVFRSGEKKSVFSLGLTRMDEIRRMCGDYLKKGERYLRSNGIIALTGKIFAKLKNAKNKPVLYSEWLPRHLPDEAELRRERETKFTWNPKISVVVPLYRTPEKYLEQLVDSMKAQTYTNWELVLSDGSGEDSPLEDVLDRMEQQDSRIHALRHRRQLHIAENTNCAVLAAEGEFLAFADHDDVLTPDALFSCVRALNLKPDTDILYSDEDKMSMDGNKFFQPHFKPDFNLDLLCTVNYICHLFVVRKSLTEKTGLFRSEFDGAQDYDFIFRCTEASEKIVHIPRILYHWRSHENSTAENPESKRYAFEAGKRAVQAHYDRMGIPAKAKEGEYLGLYRTEYCWPEKPLISILIPNKDHIEDLKRCMDSIEKKSDYRNFEFIIIENNSEEESTFAYYNQLKERENVRVVYYKGTFNFSKINNFGVGYARGDYLLLLNNDTEIINEGCLSELLGYCMRPDVGAVGARLYYEDDTIQHAGVVIGFGGIAGHCFVQQQRSATGYCHRIICAQDYSAVTAACMMVRKNVYEEVGGMTETLAVAFNDIDFCMKVGKAGYRVVYNPYAELYHYESKSRGLEDTPEKKARFNREISIFDERWPEILKNGDPYYNPNLTLDSQDFSLKRI